MNAFRKHVLPALLGLTLAAAAFLFLVGVGLI